MSKILDFQNRKEKVNEAAQKKIAKDVLGHNVDFATNIDHKNQKHVQWLVKQFGLVHIYERILSRIDVEIRKSGSASWKFIEKLSEEYEANLTEDVLRFIGFTVEDVLFVGKIVTRKETPDASS